MYIRLLQMKNKTIEERCSFDTQRLRVSSWTKQIKGPGLERKFAKRVVEILTPDVTKALPAGWQNITSAEDALKWIRDRDQESHFLAAQLSSSGETVGFIFLYEYMPGHKYFDLRFGYLLSEEVWGIGLGTELIEGLINWCKAAGDIRSITGGVETTNIGSIRVMEKAGFTISKTETPLEDVVFYVYRFSPTRN